MCYERGVVRFVLEFCDTFIHVNLYHYIFERVLIIANLDRLIRSTKFQSSSLQ